MMPYTREVLRLSALSTVAIVLAGCPPLGTTEFRNATDDPITVRWAREQVSIPAGASVPVKSYEFPDAFEVITPRHTWHYVAKFPGRDYMAPGFTFGLRVQPDGRIYAFQDSGAKKKFSKQPNGFPLHPGA